MIDPRLLSIDQVFVSNDDLISEFPEDADLPSSQLFKEVGSKAIYRQYAGDYSWMFTVVPTVNQEELYRVSVVVFYKRRVQLDTSDPEQPERMVSVIHVSESLRFGLGSGEIHLRADNRRSDLERIRPGEWLMISVWRPVRIGQLPLYRWYRIGAVDDEIEGAPSGPFTRWVTVIGPDSNPALASSSNTKTFATLVEGVVAVYEKTVRIDEF